MSIRGSSQTQSFRFASAMKTPNTSPVPPRMRIASRIIVESLVPASGAAREAGLSDEPVRDAIGRIGSAHGTHGRGTGGRRHGERRDGQVCEEAEVFAHLPGAH